MGAVAQSTPRLTHLSPQTRKGAPQGTCPRSVVGSMAEGDGSVGVYVVRVSGGWLSLRPIHAGAFAKREKVLVGLLGWR